MRRRGRVTEAIEKFSVIKTLKAVSDAHVVVLVLDARQEISDQDAHIAGFILEEGRALVVAVNKWDDLPDYEREMIKVTLVRKLDFLSFANLHFISALKGQGIGAVMRSVDGAFEAAMAKLFATEAAQRVVDGAVQLFGGQGVIAPNVVERLYREVRALRIYEGASEVQKLVIARQIMSVRSVSLSCTFKGGEYRFTGS